MHLSHVAFSCVFSRGTTATPFNTTIITYSSHSALLFPSALIDLPLAIPPINHVK